MSKNTLLVGVAAVAMAVTPLFSFAAVTIHNYGMTVNGKQTDQVHAGSTYKLSFSVDANSGDEVEYVEVSHIDENGDLAQATQCYAVNPRLVNVANGQVNLNVKTVSDLPDGPYDVRVRTFGMSGLQQSNGCDFNNFGDEFTFENRLFIDHTSSVTTSDPTVGPSATVSPTPTPSVAGLLQQLCQMGYTQFCATPVPPTGGGSADVHIDYDLRYGMMHDAEVTELQSFLIAKGLLNIAAPTGNFLGMTQAAVKQYQVMRGISPVGIVGPQTRAAINAEATGTQG